MFLFIGIFLLENTNNYKSSQTCFGPRTLMFLRKVGREGMKGEV